MPITIQHGLWPQHAQDKKSTQLVLHCTDHLVHNFVDQHSVGEQAISGSDFSLEDVLPAVLKLKPFFGKIARALTFSHTQRLRRHSNQFRAFQCVLNSTESQPNQPNPTTPTNPT
jgi:hypothetical protein